MIDPARLEALHRKCLDNTVTKEELAAAYAELRQARTAIPLAKGGSRATAGKAKKTIDSDDLLAQLEGL